MNTLEYLTFVSSVLSITGTSIILITFALDASIWKLNFDDTLLIDGMHESKELSKEHKKKIDFKEVIENYSRLLLFLSSLDLLCGIFSGIHIVAPINDVACSIYGYILSWTALSRVTIIVSLSLESYLIVSQKHLPFINPLKRTIFYVTFSILFPIPLVGCPIIIYGRTIYTKGIMPWCFISSSYPWIQVFSYHGWVIICCFLCIIFNGMVLYSSYQQSDQFSRYLPAQRKYKGTYLIGYTFSFFIVSLGGISHRLYELFHNDKPPPWIIFSHAFLGPLQGFINALLFGYTNSIVARTWRQCGKKLNEYFENSPEYTFSTVDTWSTYKSLPSYKLCDKQVELQKSLPKNEPLLHQEFWRRLF